MSRKRLPFEIEGTLKLIQGAGIVCITDNFFGKICISKRHTYKRKYKIHSAVFEFLIDEVIFITA